ncbi:inner membrane complex protein 1i, putative [Hepatocystis sp. ex Piliocolobus tephrosceles]|nr:inner membrane complex protein 1i, putative [Hepatocystis sp. ex Piliocolobus tephrosceles]
MESNSVSAASVSSSVSPPVSSSVSPPVSPPVSPSVSSNVPFTFEHSRNQKNRILKPIRQEKIFKVPVTKFVEKIIEKEEIKYVNKYVDVIKPIVTCKTKHVPKLVYLDKIKYEPKFIEKEKIIHVPKIEYTNKIVEVPVFIHRHNIIERKIPIVVERVIPVLKVKKDEKCVVTNSVKIPIICQSEKIENNADINNDNFKRINEENTSRNLTVNNIYKMNTLKDNDKETYIKDMCAPIEYGNESHNITTSPKTSHTVIEEFIDEKVNINNIDNEVYNNGSINRSLTSYKEAIYNEANNEQENYKAVDRNSENVLSVKCESLENASHNLNKNSSDIGDAENTKDITDAENNENIIDTKVNKHLHASRVSIHMPANTNLTKESIERQYLNLSYNNNDYNMNLNYVVSDDKIINNNNFTTNYETGYTNGLNSKQCIGASFNGFAKPSVQNIEFNSTHSYFGDIKQSMELEQRKRFSTANVNNPSINCTVSQNSFKNSQYITGTPNMTPSFENKNKQTFVSVRPATILEYTTKPVKPITNICNFMNKCCGKP